MSLPNHNTERDLRNIASQSNQSGYSDVANLNSITNIAVTNVGSVDSQADIALAANQLKSTIGTDGSGVKIGILSDSFNRSNIMSTNLQTDIASGDLPGAGNPNGYNIPVTILDDSANNLYNTLIDEGRAMAQLIHDIAPGAELLFHTAFNGAQDFANGILELAAAGADIIVDDISYLDQPFFQDGVIAQAVDQVAEQGVMYFTSAGNAGNNSYEANYQAGDDYYFVNEFHDFDPGAGVDVRMSVTIEAGGSFFVSMQWDDPFASAGGLGAKSDLGMALLSGTNAITVVDQNNVLSGDAYEILAYTNTSSFEQTLDFVIFNNGSVAPTKVKFIEFQDQTSFNQYLNDSSTIFGQAAAEGAFAVGAAYYEDTPAYGDSTIDLASYSSRGNPEILFDDDGNRLENPEIRQGVDLVAVDGVDNSFFGFDYDNNGYPNFFGTSAAAPNAAAVAALLKSARPDATSQQISQAMQLSALDIGVLGVDEDSGYGLVQADLALAELDDIISGADNEITNEITNEINGVDNNIEEEVIIGTPEDDIIRGLGGDDKIISEAGNDELYGDDGEDRLYAGEGDDTLNGGGDSDYLYGDLGNDILAGNAGDDTLRGVEGDDILDGGAGNDIVYGDTGNDSLDGGDGDDSVRGSQGRDTLNGGDGNDTLNGGDESDDFAGGSGDDYIIGKDGQDKAFGDAGNDSLFGGNDSDSLYGDAGDDSIDGGDNGDSLRGGSGNDIIMGDAGNDYIKGDDGDDTISGDAGNDYLHGAYGNDILTAGDGDDTINGSFENDILSGGAGADIFIYSRLSTSSKDDHDIILDFTVGQDLIDLSALNTSWSSINTLAVTDDSGVIINFSSQESLTISGLTNIQEDFFTFS